MRLFFILVTLIVSASINANDSIKIIELTSEKTKIHVVEASITNSVIQIVTPKSLSGAGESEHSYSGFSLDEYFSFSEARVVHSGGFLSSYQPPYPLGFVKINNKEVNRIHKSWLLNGVFCTRKGSILIRKIEEADNLDEWESCLQSGPLLIESGLIQLKDIKQINKLKEREYSQSFVCKDDQDHLYLGVTEKMKLVELIKILVKPKSSNGLGCIDAINLPGAMSAGMIVNDKADQKIFGNVDLLQSNSIIIK